jgi:hypothetical protein
VRRYIISRHQILLGDEIKEVEMGKTCGMCGEDEECAQIFNHKTQRDETSWEL